MRGVSLLGKRLSPSQEGLRPMGLVNLMQSYFTELHPLYSSKWNSVPTPAGSGYTVCEYTLTVTVRCDARIANESSRSNL
jgi:hypothetical protein